MTDFLSIVKNILEEQGKTVRELLDSGVIPKNTLYKYKQRNPSLQTLIKIANYLEVSIDYIYERNDRNNFIPYSYNQSDFHSKLSDLIRSSGISNRQFCKDLHYAKDNVLRYKKGIGPSVRTLFEIANFFDCSVDDLLTREE